MVVDLLFTQPADVSRSRQPGLTCPIQQGGGVPPGRRGGEEVARVRRRVPGPCWRVVRVTSAKASPETGQRDR